MTDGAGRCFFSSLVLEVNTALDAQELSDLFYQESYSYELAEVFLGGENEEMLEDAYRRTLDSLPIHLQPMPILT